NLLAFQHKVQQALFDVLEHKHFPLEKIIELMDPMRKENSSPLIQALFTFNQKVFQDDSQFALELASVQLSASDVPPLESKYELSLELAENAEGFSGRLGYWPGHVSKRMARQFARHFINCI